ncbi:Protein indeterminate-domain 2 [Ananas comosus]|uniref:Protein indeterminate-domain 2 n=1 Tax=Ananas comosus TaxID=4615 RepID=A0A199W2W0_ANACO|nr:Protein indeterminate-domain 2 [Ananas comosus]
MATNRFVCEICHKGFQRDQNLQLHRRGHNLPWKLRQRASGGDVAEAARKKVYVCPEPTCVHHEASRALGDLTGIKKHFCRKHGEKKWKCDKCSKKYAVQSDWKAHSKICGTREYKCDCGTVFSRRDSFITHRAFCDALGQESNKLNQPMMAHSNLQGPAHVLLSAGNAPVTTSVGLADFTDDVKDPQLKPFSDETALTSPRPLGMAGCMLSSFGPSSLHLKGTIGPLGLDGLGDANIGQVAAGSSGHMSATALLQKAAQMGAAPVSNTVSSAMMHRGVVSMMAGPDRFSGTRPCGPIKAHGLYNEIRLQEQQDHLAELGMNQHYSAPMNDLSAFSRPIPYLLGGSGGSGSGSGGGGGRGGDVRMVDYLGVGPQRSPHEQHNPQQHVGLQGVIPHQRLQSLGPFQEMTHGLISLEKPIWDV